MICENLKFNDGVLYFGGHSTKELIDKYSSPLYVMDEERIRYNMRTYVNAMNKYFPEGSLPLFASKAASFKHIYKLANEENMGADVVSSGEIYTALSAGFPMDKVYFHGNNKTDFDIAYAMDSKVAYFVADSMEEIDAIDNIAKEKGIVQKILLRLTPGIDPHTYEAVATGKVDSKFGFAIETGTAEEITKYTLTKENIDLCGFHSHVGSQLFDSVVFYDTLEIMLSFMAMIKEKYGYEARQLNLGGGYGVRYVEDDPVIDIDENIKTVAEAAERLAKELNITLPAVIMEPGRSIVADAGITLYTVGVVKTIPGYKSYVAIDGGMGDNPRYALYGSSYTVLASEKGNEAYDFKCSLVGRCCESGDIIQEDIMLPKSIKRGDHIAVLTTGAYNYSMASNYNRIPRLPIVMVNKDTDYVAVKRETFEDIIRNDI